eukprot:scaffold754_cov248-Pinguiococcus_pyrenoidosus.AAC.8
MHADDAVGAFDAQPHRLDEARNRSGREHGGADHDVRGRDVIHEDRRTASLRDAERDVEHATCLLVGLLKRHVPRRPPTDVIQPVLLSEEGPFAQEVPDALGPRRLEAREVLKEDVLLQIPGDLIILAQRLHNAKVVVSHGGPSAEAQGGAPERLLRPVDELVRVLEIGHRISLGGDRRGILQIRHRSSRRSAVGVRWGHLVLLARHLPEQSPAALDRGDCSDRRPGTDNRVECLERPRELFDKLGHDELWFASVGVRKLLFAHDAAHVGPGANLQRLEQLLGISRVPALPQIAQQLLHEVPIVLLVVHALLPNVAALRMVQLPRQRQPLFVALRILHLVPEAAMLGRGDHGLDHPDEDAQDGVHGQLASDHEVHGQQDGPAEELPRDRVVHPRQHGQQQGQQDQAAAASPHEHGPSPVRGGPQKRSNLLHHGLVAGGGVARRHQLFKADRPIVVQVQAPKQSSRVREGVIIRLFPHPSLKGRRQTAPNSAKSRP